MIYAHEPLIAERLYSRVIADTEEELQEFGEFLGLQAEWIRDDPRFHFCGLWDQASTDSLA